MQLKESQIRGAYLSLACDMDKLMDDICTKCKVDKAAKRGEFLEVTMMAKRMGNRITDLKECLGIYRNGVYLRKFSKEIEIIEELLVIRNLMAHGYSDYDNEQKNTSYITLYKIEGKKGNMYRWDLSILVKPFLMQLDKYRKNLLRIAQLAIIITMERGEYVYHPLFRLIPYGSSTNHVVFEAHLSGELSPDYKEIRSFKMAGESFLITLRK